MGLRRLLQRDHLLRKQFGYLFLPVRYLPDKVASHHCIHCKPKIHQFCCFKYTVRNYCICMERIPQRVTERVPGSSTHVHALPLPMFSYNVPLFQYSIRSALFTDIWIPPFFSRHLRREFLDPLYTFTCITFVYRNSGNALWSK